MNIQGKEQATLQLNLQSFNIQGINAQINNQNT